MPYHRAVYINSKWGKLMLHSDRHLYKYLRYTLIFGLLCIIAASLVKSFYLEPVGAITQKKTFEHLKAAPFTQTVPDNTFSETCTYHVPVGVYSSPVLAVEPFSNTVQVALDGREIFSYEDSEKEKGFNILWIPLPDDAAGKLLTVTCSSASRNSIEPLIMLGDQNALFINYLGDNFISALVGSASVLMGIILCAASFLLYLKNRGISQAALFYLGIFILLTGIWILTDSDILQFITGRTASTTLVSFLAFMFMPYFFLLFFQRILEKSPRPLRILGMLMLVNAAFVTVCYLFRILILYATLLGSHLLLVVVMGFILKISFTEFRRRQSQELKKILIGIGLLLAGVLAALAAFYIDVAGRWYPICYSVGILFFILCLTSAALDNTYRRMSEHASLKAYKKIAYTDVMTGMNNRSAFTRYEKDHILPAASACLVFDINNLKHTNDTFGHLAGDELIIEAAQCITETFHSAGKCFRTGGDEFVVILENIQPDGLRRKLQDMKALLDEKNKSRSPALNLAYGCNYADITGRSVREMFEKADREMYDMKKRMKQEEG
ncbi:hypothetical protein B5F07_18170 [Lachnoclostridium sp. An169]|nr:hypothetical protein B5F07_18170 [Lachnoclostridium sp. An169]